MKFFLFTLHNWLEQSEVNDLVEWIQSTESTAAQGIKTICDEGWATLAMTECKPLPDFNAAALLAHLDDNANEFLAAPEWQGRCYETSPLARQLDHPLIQTLLRELGDSCLLTRYVARLVELAKIPQQLRDLLEGAPRQRKVSVASLVMVWRRLKPREGAWFTEWISTMRVLLIVIRFWRRQNGIFIRGGWFLRGWPT